MNLGFMIKWPKGSLNRGHGNVIGDELFGESLCAAINRSELGSSAKLYAPNDLPKSKLDVLIYLNDIPPVESYASKHVLYLQNGYGEKASDLLERLIGLQYDSYIFFSRKLLLLHEQRGGVGFYLPFGVDTTLFKPQPFNSTFCHEVVYIGNDIKGEKASNRYLYPAVNFDFGLYGNWEKDKPRLKFWKRWKKVLPYQKRFEAISRGKISQENVPILYSSSKINLNCTLQDCIDWDVITLRTFEVLACRGFLISDKVPAAEDALINCMVFTDGGEHLIEQISYYLSHEKKRIEISENGYEYVLKHATIEARAVELINFIGELS